MKIHRLRSYENYLEYQSREADELKHHWAILQRHIPSDRSPFTIEGYSYTAGQQVSFQVDYQHAGTSGGIVWRERVGCPITAFNNRMRYTFHIFDIESETYKDSKIYLTEQITPIYEYFHERYPNVIGSEYLGEQVPFGTKNTVGVQNETLCELSFPDESFDALVTLDVIEHIPDYFKAFKECFRVLKKGGRMLCSVPFVPKSEKNIIAARLGSNGIEHVLSPQYHGDPLSQEGVLCFTYFGWEMLDQLRSVGFSDAYAVCAHSLEYGYLGGEQFLFIAKK